MMARGGMCSGGVGARPQPVIPEDIGLKKVARKNSGIEKMKFLNFFRIELLKEGQEKAILRKHVKEFSSSALFATKGPPILSKDHDMIDLSTNYKRLGR